MELRCKCGQTYLNQSSLNRHKKSCVFGLVIIRRGKRKNPEHLQHEDRVPQGQEEQQEEDLSSIDEPLSISLCSSSFLLSNFLLFFPFFPFFPFFSPFPFPSLLSFLRSFFPSLSNLLSFRPACYLFRYYIAICHFFASTVQAGLFYSFLFSFFPFLSFLSFLSFISFLSIISFSSSFLLSNFHFVLSFLSRYRVAARYFFFF